MIIINGDEVAALTHRVAFDPPRSIAEAFYGPVWRDSIIEPEYRAPRATRFPKAHDAAALLEPLIVGCVFFDDRSSRVSRTDGWWTHDGAGAWRKTSLSEITASLLGPARGLVRVAQERVAAVPTRREGERADGSPYVLACVSSLERMLASGDRCIAATAAVWRSDVRFRLPSAAARSIVLDWLGDSVVSGAWDEYPLLRVPPATVLRRYREDGGTLPTKAFFGALDDVIGAARKIGVRFYELPADLDALEAQQLTYA